MANPLADIWSFGPAAAKPDGQLLVALFADAMIKQGVTDTTLLWFDGQKKISIIGELEDLVRSVRTTDSGFVAVTEDGVVVRVDGGQMAPQISLFLRNPSPRPFGPARCCHVDGDMLTIVGLNQTALVYDRATDRVVDISNGLAPDRTRGLEAIAGPAWNDLIGVDLTGGIWHFDGHRWVDCQSPVNAPLTSVCQMPNGEYFAAGLHGVVVVGKGHVWKALEIPLSAINFYSTASWNEQLYASGPRGIVRVMKDTEEAFAVDFGDLSPETFYQVISGGPLLWSVGPKDVFVNRGGNWISLFR